MKITYFPGTDTLYIHLTAKPSAESEEVAQGVVLDFDAEGDVAGIEIEGASARLELNELVVTKLPWSPEEASA